MALMVSDQKTFVTLMQVAQEDPEVKVTLKAILKLESIHRKSLLNTWLMELQAKGAPQDFIDALACLVDDRVSRQALALIEGKI